MEAVRKAVERLVERRVAAVSTVVWMEGAEAGARAERPVELQVVALGFL
tara:strand:- start:1177 stop:1323 length:147 start_codon:yes stop_codon:yes gene_type:complete